MSNRTEFNFFHISKLRLELMGVGTLLILLCHSVGNNVKMSGFLAKIADNGQIGVGLFLFLSGLGLSFSLNRYNWNLDKEAWLRQWYKKCFGRVLYPYFLIAIPYLLYKLFWGELSVVRGLTNLLTIILNHKSWIICGIDLSYGHYLEYFIVLFFCMLIAYCVNSFVKQKIK